MKSEVRYHKENSNLSLLNNHIFMGPEDGTIKLLNKGLSDLYFVRPFSTELGQGTLGVVPRTIGAKVKSFLRGGLPFLVRGRS